MGTVRAADNRYATLGKWCKTWVNRRSRLGSRPAVSAPPPREHGEPWWTSPPVSVPEPEHVDYVVAYRAELVRGLADLRGGESERKRELLRYVNEWLVAARRLRHERGAMLDLGLQDPEDVVVLAHRLLRSLIAHAHQTGRGTTEREDRVADALQGLADGIVRRRSARTGGR